MPPPCRFLQVHHPSSRLLLKFSIMINVLDTLSSCSCTFRLICALFPPPFRQRQSPVRSSCKCCPLLLSGCFLILCRRRTKNTRLRWIHILASTKRACLSLQVLQLPRLLMEEVSTVPAERDLHLGDHIPEVPHREERRILTEVHNVYLLRAKLQERV